MGKSSGFTVGPTVKACTKGIWIWGKALDVAGSDVHVLFLDTEGLGSTIRGSTYDCRIFALSLLLSSFFVYNSVGVIDGDAISRLGLVVNLTKHIQVGDPGPPPPAPRAGWCISLPGPRLPLRDVSRCGLHRLHGATRMCTWVSCLLPRCDPLPR
jgi:hypothetical protein